jgi:Ras-related protein Rab-1A
MAKRDYDHLYKVVLIGDSTVGKSSILTRYADDEYMDSYISTIGVDFRFHPVLIRDESGMEKRIKMQIWECSGQAKFRSVTNAYYRSSDAILIIFDLTSVASFSSIREWAKEAHTFAPDIPMFIVGNKCDLIAERTVSTHEGEEIAHTFGAKYVEVSARTGTNVDEAFEFVAQYCTHRSQMQERQYGANAATSKTALLQRTAAAEPSWASKLCPKWPKSK